MQTPDHQIILERARSLFDGKIHSIELIDSGWSNIVVQINEDWIFRFTRGLCEAQFQLEADFLLSMKASRSAPFSTGNYPVSIPRIIAHGSDYLVYRKVPGERFSPQRYCQLSANGQLKVVRHLASFVSKLHRMQYRHPALSAAPYGGGDFWTELWPAGSRLLQPSTRSRAQSFFEEKIQAANATAFNKTLIHADLATNNVLVNFDTDCGVGVIDFSDLSLSDPAADFAGFYRHFGRAFIDQLLTHYTGSIEDNFFARIELHARRKIFFIVHYARKYGFDQHLPGLAEQMEELFAR